MKVFSYTKWIVGWLICEIIYDHEYFDVNVVLLMRTDQSNLSFVFVHEEKFSPFFRFAVSASIRNVLHAGEVRSDAYLSIFCDAYADTCWFRNEAGHSADEWNSLVLSAKLLIHMIMYSEYECT